MLKSCKLRTVFLPCAIWFNSLADHDRVEIGAVPQLPENETGWDRLTKMFEIDEFGNLSKEVVTILHVGAMSSFVGAVYGGVLHSRTAYMDFIKNNQATAFETHFQAKKKLQDKVTISFGKGAFKWAWRLSLFCSTFVGISTAISVYRNKSGISEYIAAGTIAGTLYKFKMGPRGWVVGGGLGAALGLLAGGATTILLKLSGFSMEDIRNAQYNLQQQRSDYINKGISKYMEKEELELLLKHSERVGDTGKNIENLEKTQTKTT